MRSTVKIIGFVISFIYILTLYSCVKVYKVDIYKKVPLGSTLTKEILTHCDQIFKTEDDLILLFNTASGGELHYDPHVLFFNSKNILYGACYYPSEKIDSIKKMVIYGNLNKERSKRKDAYRNDMPPQYSISLNENPIGMIYSVGNKVIEEINVDSTGNVVKFKVFESDDPSILAAKDLRDINQEFLQKFNLKKTVTYNISDLLFTDIQRGVILKHTIYENRELEREYFVVRNIQVIDDFFDKLWIHYDTTKKK